MLDCLRQKSLFFDRLDHNSFVSNVLDQKLACFECGRPKQTCSTELNPSRYVSTVLGRKNMRDRVLPMQDMFRPWSTEFGYVSTFKPHEPFKFKSYNYTFPVTFL